ncbi:MAG: hypothetical protein EB829_04355 [Nitrosopumilus sp. H8]|nr:MAG: hypothetical protein EB829_04355 [Nitrosopumilus sp. H8]
MWVLIITAIALLLVVIFHATIITAGHFLWLFSPYQGGDYGISYYIKNTVFTITAGMIAATGIWLIFLLGYPVRLKETYARFCRHKTMRRQDVVFASLIAAMIIIPTTYVAYLVLGS